MPTDAVILVLIVAIVANLVIMALLVLNLWIRRRHAPETLATQEPPRSTGGAPAAEIGQMPDATRLERAISGPRMDAYGLLQTDVPAAEGRRRSSAAVQPASAVRPRQRPGPFATPAPAPAPVAVAPEPAAPAQPLTTACAAGAGRRGRRGRCARASSSSRRWTRCATR